MIPFSGVLQALFQGIPTILPCRSQLDHTIANGFERGRAVLNPGPVLTAHLAIWIWALSPVHNRRRKFSKFFNQFVH
jgi:hypothetical protein